MSKQVFSIMPEAATARLAVTDHQLHSLDYSAAYESKDGMQTTYTGFIQE